MTTAWQAAPINDVVSFNLVGCVIGWLVAAGRCGLSVLLGSGPIPWPSDVHISKKFRDRTEVPHGSAGSIQRRPGCRSILWQFTAMAIWNMLGCTISLY